MYKVAQVAEMLGCSIQTLYYYEKEGLLFDIQRDQSNNRIYTDKDIEWIKTVMIMREIDIPVKVMKEYFDLLQLGSSTTSQRYDIVLEYKEKVKKKLDVLNYAYELILLKEKFHNEIEMNNITYENFEEESKVFKKMVSDYNRKRED